MKPCRCPLYPFPHRRIDRCDDAEAEAMDVFTDTRTQREIDAEALYLFDLAEAQAINVDRNR